MSIRDRPSPARDGKLGKKVYLHPHREQGGMPLMEGSKGAGYCFFSLTDVRYSKFQTHTLEFCPEKLGYV